MSRFLKEGLAAIAVLFGGVAGVFLFIVVLLPAPTFTIVVIGLGVIAAIIVSIGYLDDRDRW